MKVNTGGYGGKKIRETVSIKTNDSRRPWIAVTVTGMVEKFAEIRPERVHLSGPAGTPIFVDLEVVPRKDYLFTIKSIEAKRGNFITYEIVQRCGENKNSCIVTVKNKRAEKGRYADVLYIMTDNGIRPKIPIYITGVIE